MGRHLIARHAGRERLRRAAQRQVARLARRVGLDTVAADYNSPVVDIASLPSELWNEPAPVHGIELDLDRQLDLIEQQLEPHMAELDIPLRSPSDPSALHLDNPWYGPMDAHVLYAMVRHLRPNRVLELGSGFSSLIIDRALAADHGASFTHEVIDPFPSPLLTRLGNRVRLTQESAANVEAGLFEGLAAGDILFVDTTHAVRPGGEVLRLVLQVLPTLAPGVAVHFHDIYVPFPYPRILYELYGVQWQEQYLLQAFLAYNPLFEVVLANHALWRLRRERVKRIVPTLREGMEPSALWVTRTSAPDAEVGARD